MLHPTRARAAAAAVGALLVIGAGCSTGSGTGDAATPADEGASEATIAGSTPTADGVDPADTTVATGDTAAHATETGSADAAPVDPATVPEALQFTAPLVGGGEFSGAAYADKPTVFWFWAPT